MGLVFRKRNGSCGNIGVTKLLAQVVACKVSLVFSEKGDGDRGRTRAYGVKGLG